MIGRWRGGGGEVRGGVRTDVSYGSGGGGGGGLGGAAWGAGGWEVGVGWGHVCYGCGQHYHRRVTERPSSFGSSLDPSFPSVILPF